jgi:hypothetical protein
VVAQVHERADEGLRVDRALGVPERARARVEVVDDERRQPPLALGQPRRVAVSPTHQPTGLAR